MMNFVFAFLLAFGLATVLYAVVQIIRDARVVLKEFPE